MEHAFFIRALVSMRAEVVTLCLNQVGRQNGSAVAIVIRHRSGEGWNRDTVLYSVGNHVTQRLLVLVCNLLKVRCQQKVSDTCVFSIGIGDFLQELRTNDATRAEDLRDLAVVQVPVVLVRRRTQL